MMMKTTLCRVRALPGTPSVPPARLASTRMVGPQRYRLCPPVRLASTPPHMTIANRRSRSPDVACSASTTGGAPAGSDDDGERKLSWKEEFPSCVNFRQAAIAAAVGLGIRLLIPCPEGLSMMAWNLTSIFMFTAVGLVTKPLPLSGWAFLGLTIAVASKTLTFAQAFSAFTQEAIWLVVLSFFFAKGVESTGLGQRIANMFVRSFGSSSLGLAYSLVGAEMCITPAMPSSAARCGAIFNPVIKSISSASGSLPNDPSSKRLGKFLTMTQLQCSCSSSAMFLSGAAQNFLTIKLAAELGVVIPDVYITWLKGAIVPGLLSLLLIPWIIYKLDPPELLKTPEAPGIAARKLEEMGSLTRPELAILSVLGVTLVLWVFGPRIGVSAGTAAMMGLSALMASGVLTWEQCLQNKGAWDTLMWFAILTGMAGQLNAMGVTSHFSGSAGAALTSLNLGWPAVWGLLCGAYFVMHYVFASQTGHVAALYSAFLAMLLSANVPGVMAALSLCWTSSLYSAVSHFASGQAAVYAGTGYITVPEIFKWGAIIGVVTMVFTWGIAGTAWWKLIGYL